MKALQDADLRKFLTARLQAVPDSIETIRPGEWSRAYAIRRNGEELVVRFSPYREDFEKDRAAAQWSSASLPIPPLIELGEAFGVSYAVSPRVVEHFSRRSRATRPPPFCRASFARWTPHGRSSCCP
jgi:hypothetical protein